MATQKEKGKVFFCCGLAVFILLASPLFDRVHAEKIKDAEKLFETKCSHCHSLDNATSKQYSRQEWTKTVSRMREHGSDLKDDEAKKIIDYLTKKYGR